MALDAAQTAKVQAWIQRHPFIFGTNTGKMLPSLPFICGGCGLTFLVNCNNIGLP